MAREKKIEIAAVNLTIQPHSTQKYIELFRDAFKLGSEVQIYGDEHGILTSMVKQNSSDEISPLEGDIFKFTKINKDQKWFNISTNEFASDDELTKVNIPDHLKPNSSRFSFIFYPKEHLFFYESYYDGNSLGPSNLHRFLERLFVQDVILEKYGKVELTIVPEINKLEDALKMKVKEKMELMIKRPNPDDQAQAEKDVLERLENWHVSEYEETYKAVSGQSIEVDDELRMKSKIAAKNGTVKIKGKDEAGHPAEYSTVRHPWRKKAYYDPDITRPFQVLASISNQMKNVVQTWFKQP